MEDTHSQRNSMHLKLHCALRRSASVIEHSLFEQNEKKENVLYRRYNKHVTSPLPKLKTPKFKYVNSVSFKSPIHLNLPESTRSANEVLANSIMKIKNENKNIVMTKRFNIKKYNNKILNELYDKIGGNSFVGLKYNLSLIEQQTLSGRQKRNFHPYFELAKKLEFKVPKHLTDKLFKYGSKRLEHISFN